MENKVSEIRTIEQRAEESVRAALEKKEKEIRNKQLEAQEMMGLAQKEQTEKAEEVFRNKIEKITEEIELMKRERDKEIDKLAQAGRKNIPRAVDFIIDYVLK
jgi:vacuolar-type H+-ATPase subunit H